MNIRPIAYIISDFPDKFGVPRQSGLVRELEAIVVFEKEYRVPEALRGIDGYSHLWLIWHFSDVRDTEWRPTVRPPRLGGNVRMGVFATRSPYRPNSLGLSSVRLIGVEENENYGTVLRVAGADLVSGTPIFDIKPYLPHSDCHADAVGGFSDAAVAYSLTVECDEALLALVPDGKVSALLGVLAQDPRPSYQDDAERIYGMSFAGFEVKFKVADNVLTVTAIEKM